MKKCDIISKIYKQIISTGNVNKDSTCIRSVGVKEWNSGSQIVEQWESKCGTVGVKEWNSRSQRVEQWESKCGTVGVKEWNSGSQIVDQWESNSGTV